MPWVLENSEDLGLIDLNTAINLTVTARVFENSEKCPL